MPACHTHRDSSSVTQFTNMLVALPSPNPPGGAPDARADPTRANPGLSSLDSRTPHARPPHTHPPEARDVWPRPFLRSPRPFRRTLARLRAADGRLKEGAGLSNEDWRWRGAGPRSRRRGRGVRACGGGCLSARASGLRGGSGEFSGREAGTGSGYVHVVCGSFGSSRGPD